MSEYLTALEIATTAHKEQKDKCGVAYINHPKTVSSYCKSDRAKIAALLHDVVEDSDITLEELHLAGIGEDVIIAVDCLTKRYNEKLNNYFKRVATNDIAIEVKFADLRHNSDKSRWPLHLAEEAYNNSMKYGERIRKLYKLVGSKRSLSLMSKETFDYLSGYLLENL